MIVNYVNLAVTIWYLGPQILPSNYLR